MTSEKTLAKPTLVKRGNWIPVVAAILQRSERVLVGLRPEGHSLSGVWEFPGGKIELGESPEVALKRELKEELGIEADVGELILASTHSYGTTGILLLFFRVRYWKGELKPVHHTELKWAQPAELANLPMPDANRKVLDRLFTDKGDAAANRLSL
jgi:8-oxo-dGTP diphosphatase